MLCCWVTTLLCVCVWSVGVYVPVGGKKLLTFMDDFNMPAKDTFGSQPPLELIRHWIDYGFWYDRAKQIVKHIKVRKKWSYIYVHVSTLLTCTHAVEHLLFHASTYRFANAAKSWFAFIQYVLIQLVVCWGPDQALLNSNTPSPFDSSRCLTFVVGLKLCGATGFHCTICTIPFLTLVFRL